MTLLNVSQSQRGHLILSINNTIFLGLYKDHLENHLRNTTLWSPILGAVCSEVKLLSHNWYLRLHQVLEWIFSF